VAKQTTAAKALFVAPTALNSGLTSICLGLVRALDSVGLRVGFCKPVSQPREAGDTVDRSIHFARAKTDLNPPQPIALKYAQRLMSQQQGELLLEQVVGLYHSCAANADVVIVEGLVPDRSEAYTARINAEIARALNAEVILVANPEGRSPQELDDHIEMASRLYASPDAPDVIGVILNKVGAPAKENDYPYRIESDVSAEPSFDYAQACQIFHPSKLRLLGCIPWQRDLIAPRTSDMARVLKARVLHEGKLHYRRVAHVSLLSRTIRNTVDLLRPGALIVTPGDRDDLIVATCMAALSGIPLAGLVLTGNLEPDPRIAKLCKPALDTGLPVLLTEHDTYGTASLLVSMNTEVPIDDTQRIEQVMESVSQALDVDWLRDHCAASRELRLSPAAFRYQLTERARAANKRIILPEGNEPRTIRAAAICAERGIARCVLLGKADEIHAVAETQGVTLPSGIEIIDPDSVRSRYIEPMMELRKHKGLTADMAEAQLEDNVVLATMMLAQGEVDGLVSGAVHTTANTIRPALQLIKSPPGVQVVSSVFFMCLPEQVLVYGDCAINPDPNAEELADIAIQSADSAATFGIPPRVAMISYSTGSSGAGVDVDKVREATRIAREKRPDLLIDGPLQYDAAAINSVARAKAPNSPVAGRATVFVFPDLNTGNTTYKAVQRSANVISIGPMLQGLRKPVNDLSRGALVDDIVFTVALTAVQATQAES